MLKPLQNCSQEFCESQNDRIDMVLAANRVIDFYKEGFWFYQIFIDDIREGRAALDWIRQISTKTWMTPRLLSSFCSLAIGALQNGK